jgi:hypothetical protein
MGMGIAMAMAMREVDMTGAGVSIRMDSVKYVTHEIPLGICRFIKLYIGWLIRD